MEKIEMERIYSINEIVKMQLSSFLDSKTKIRYLLSKEKIKSHKPTGGKTGKIGIYGKDIFQFLKSNN